MQLPHASLRTSRHISVPAFTPRDETFSLVAVDGLVHPSQADELITQRLREALGLIDVRVLDHLIVAGSTVTSMAERGVL